MGPSAFSAAGLADPRGQQAQEAVKPARRTDSLAGKHIVLIDNKKLARDFGPYWVIWDILTERFPEAQWTLFKDDLSKYNEVEAAALADQLIRDEKPDAVILALADAGVSLPTSLLALALERRGVPTVVLATVVGAGFVHGIFSALAPGLEPVILRTLQADSVDRVKALLEENLDEIRQRLTTSKAGAAPAAAASPAINGARSWPDVGDAMQEFQDWLERSGIGDGLPLIPPSNRAVEALLKSVPEDPDTVVFSPAITSGRLLRIRDAAANAAMTACPPRAFPVVIAALRAMTYPDYRLSWSAVTTHPAGNAVIFSGPNAAEYGLSGGAGCLGPGHRTNASVGRAVSLCVWNVFGARPGEVDLTSFGSPAEFTYCFAEAVEESPWPSLADEIGGGKSGVFVVKSETPRNVLEHRALTPAGLIKALAGTATSIGANNSNVPGDLVVILNPEHAHIFSDGGWTRDDVAYGMYNLARNSRASIEGHGSSPIRPAYMEVLDQIPVVRSPREVRIVVAGAAGPQSMVALPWSNSRGQWHPIGEPGPPLAP